MTAAQQTALAQAAALLGEHFEHFVMAVTYTDAASEECVEVMPGKSRMAAVGLAAEAEFILINDAEDADETPADPAGNAEADDGEKWKQG